MSPSENTIVNQSFNQHPLIKQQARCSKQMELWWGDLNCDVAVLPRWP